MPVAESQNVKWKESWRDEYLKWICGFANAQGGKIYIGTNDDGTVIDVQESKKLMEDIPDKVRDVLGIIVDVNYKKGRFQPKRKMDHSMTIFHMIRL